MVPESTEGQFAENRYRSMSRFVLKRPPRSPAPAPVEVEKAVARLRAIGWYGRGSTRRGTGEGRCTAWHLGPPDARYPVTLKCSGRAFF